MKKVFHLLIFDDLFTESGQSNEMLLLFTKWCLKHIYIYMGMR